MEATGLGYYKGVIWVPEIMGPFWLWVILRHLIFRATTMGP